KDAVVAVEDQNFWVHDGVDPEAIVRAALSNFEEGDTVQGGSTITQQYVKNTYTTGERNLSRKLREALLASRLERELTKEQILFRYLTSIYFGDGAYGVGAAAESYFRKPVSELTASEAAMLAGTIASPNNYGPRGNAEVAERRRRQSLRAMRDQGYLTPAEFREAREQHVWYAPFGDPPGPATVVQAPPQNDVATIHPYFVDYVRRYLLARFDHETLYRGGLRVETTLDPRLQLLAQQSVSRTLDGTAPPLEMSLVTVDPVTGHVKAMVGGRDFAQNQVNLALGGTLGVQPGSSFKAFVLASAFERGITPDDRYPAPASITLPDCTGQCTISNAEPGNGGEEDLRQATAHSVNTVFAQLIQEVGPQNVAELANRLGVRSIDPATTQYGVSLALGAYETSPLEMAAGYAVLANHGVRAPATPVLRVLDDEGRVLMDNTAPQGEQVLDPAVADTVTDLMRGVIAGGTGRAADIGRPAAGKTGTAQEHRAAWFVGYTPQLSTAVWMGYSDVPRPLYGIKGQSRVYGGSFPASTWADFMRAALADQPVADFAVPGPLPVPVAQAPAPAPADDPTAPPTTVPFEPLPGAP
ncbi:MAG: transglycosylase domain-containing protein, partial [Acidimicrobiales bacterium]|nr:transglycosylase domain-containing protein [Acidimicrobiales bacterium]